MANTAAPVLPDPLGHTGVMIWNLRTNRASESAEPDKPNGPAGSHTLRQGSEIKLQSLAPAYKEDQHATYVRHLEASVTDPRNKNIALTGRYGSGKSSILDRFYEGQEEKQKRVLRISISTLGPDDDTDLTNRIQKELVKQLVYRAAAGEIRHSRFARTKDLSWYRSLLEAAGVGIVVVGILWLFGVRPDADALGTGHVALPTFAFLILVTGAAWAARWVIGMRLVSEFSTGGTSISLESQPDSYFDKYLDEIVAFFDAKKPDLVIFEDLDRFDDPQIFDSLRELNTLINASAHWKTRRERPLRFIYAIKDSLFERLGEETQDRNQAARKLRERGTDARDDVLTDASASVAGPVSKKRRDAAEAAVERANRTKFFEVVIPVVPFLSHSNAIDLLDKTLDRMQLPTGTSISRGLLDLVARYATDMRLLINICNEFVVFAQRLLWIETPAPGMKPDELFALVVYKNFHLADFEALPHRGSVLDSLEATRREAVRDAIKKLHADNRELLRADRLQLERDGLAQTLGDRFTLLLAAAGQVILTLTVGDRDHARSAVHLPEFWTDIAETRKLFIEVRHPSGHTTRSEFNEDQLKTMFPEGMDTMKWREASDEDLAAQLASNDADMAALRGAGFADLARDHHVLTNGETFDDHLKIVLGSELAQDLVRRGFVDRYYAEYSAAFYGDFLGVDVANFFRNSVWPNEIDTQFQFTTPNAVSNLLEQAPTDFTRSRSALNVQVVNHMLRHSLEQAKEVVAFLVATQDADRLAFLDAFFNDTSSCKAELVGLLATSPWRGLLDHLALQDSVPSEDTRTALLDAALMNAQEAGSYNLSEEARALILNRHGSLAAFTQEQSAERAETVLSFVRRAELITPSLRPLSDTLRPLFIETGAYALTADNLRAALSLADDEAITLDRVRKHEKVWERCRDAADVYFGAVAHDDQTEHAVQTAATLAEVISEQHGEWSDNEIKSALEQSAPESALPEITAVPQATWPAIASAGRMVPNIANLSAYSKALGVDESLARVLTVGPGEPVELEGLENAKPDVIGDLMIRVLNASSVLGSKVRVGIALQLDTKPELDAIDVTTLQPFGDDLLADLLEAELVPDTFPTFKHFSSNGWRSVSEAFKVSQAAHEFLTPDLVAGYVLDLLRDPLVPRAIHTKIIADLEAYAPDGDEEVLREAASIARRRKFRLPLLQVERAAPHAANAEDILWQLASMGDDFEGDDAIRILGLLGDDYEGFDGESGHEFDVPVTDSIKGVIDQLSVGRLAEVSGAPKRGRMKVKLV